MIRPALLFLLLACQGQEIPDHPDKLKYPPLTYTVPDPAAFRTELSTGTVCFLAEDPSLPLVNLTLLVRAGSFWEPAGKEGLAALTGSLMRTGGTKNLSPGKLDEELDFLAADLSVSIRDTSGSAELSILAKDLDRGLEILFDILRRPALDPEKLKILKAQMIDRLGSRNDSTRAIEAREASLLLYGPDHPVNRHPTRASVEAITRDDIAAYHAESFHPANFIIAASGAFKRDAFVKKLEDAFADWASKKPGTLKVPKSTYQPKPGAYIFHKEGRNITQGAVTACHLGIDIHHPEVQTLRLMNYILGSGGFNSRLTLKVRTEEGLAYDIGSDLRPGFLYPRPFEINYQSSNATCAYAARLCLEEIARFQKDGPTEKELKSAIRFFVDGFPGFFFTTKSQTVNTFARAELYGFPKDYYTTYREKIAACTAEDLKRVAREYLHPDKLVWVFVGNAPAMKKGHETHPGRLSDLGTVTDVPLPDPFTLKRPEK